MFVCAVFITFKFMGKTYDAAMIAVGHCGFGVWGVPAASRQNLCVGEQRLPPPTRAFLCVVCGPGFINLVNTFVITGFVNF